MVMQESETEPDKLTEAVKALYRDRDKYISAMEASPASDATEVIVNLLKELAVEQE